MRKIILILITILLGCNNESNKNRVSTLEKYDLKDLKHISIHRRTGDSWFIEYKETSKYLLIKEGDIFWGKRIADGHTFKYEELLQSDTIFSELSVKSKLLAVIDLMIRLNSSELYTIDNKGYTILVTEEGRYYYSEDKLEYELVSKNWYYLPN